ncbi:hypothetical protein MUN78_15530 [Leucobacter allii]|uniref:HTH marR-type domain-containing protein n=1 Tax=Leucobacter allii TaxID=2932247 RepID=A0ABY4FLB4_9MICO|nr:hypothetical protein [Leucobacter allii]UOQ57051.1 hypothetical protein MUN78_15530 [Leucobacter allii]
MTSHTTPSPAGEESVPAAREPGGSERPLGYWIRAVDRLLDAEFARTFVDVGISRRDWRELNRIGGTAPGGRDPRPRSSGRGRTSRRALEARGWIAHDSGEWRLTEAGRAAFAELTARVENIRATVSDAVAPDDLATTLASLERIAIALGWDAETPLPRRRTGRGARRSGAGSVDGRRWHGGHPPHDGHRFEDARCFEDAHRFHDEPRRGADGDPRGHRWDSRGHSWASREHRCDSREHPREARELRGRSRAGWDDARSWHDPEGVFHVEHDRGAPGQRGGSGRGGRDRAEGHRGSDRRRAAMAAYERGFRAGFANGREG